MYVYTYIAFTCRPSVDYNTIGPIYYTLVLTWRSFMGFQSCSTKITVSAPVRFSPNPPTVVVSRSTSIDGSSLNLKAILSNADRQTDKLT